MGILFCEQKVPLARGIALARTVRVSTRRTKELPHCTAKKLAAIMGVAESSVRNWSEIPTFPAANEEGQYCIRDCCWWYLSNKAAKEHKITAAEKIVHDLKLTFSADESNPEAKATATSEDQAKAAADLSYKQHVETLDLRTREATFQSKFGDAVRIRHIVPVLASLAQKIRQWAESVELKTGHPIANVIEQAVEQAVSEMWDKTGGGNGPSTE
jgi:hypothetical protein